MLKRHFFILVCLLLLLAACAQRRTAPGGTSTPLQPTATPSPRASATAAAERLVAPALSVETDEPLQTEQSATAPAVSPTPVVPPPAAVTPLPPATTPASSPLPTLSPETPAPVASYQLREWTAQDADELVARLEQFPETLPAEERGFGDGAYYAAFRYAALAQEEALTRFPDAAEADDWRWALAYNYARVGDGRAAGQYGRLIEQALQSAVVTPGDLTSWFAGHEPRLTLEQSQLDAPSGFLSAHLLELRAEESGTFFWMLYDGQNYSVYPLNGERDLDLAYGAGLNYDLTDVTGDGSPELVAVHAHQPGADPGFYYTDLVLFDLSQAPPRRLSLQPPPTTHLGWGERDSWTVVISANGATQLRLRGLVSWRCDAVEQVSNYVWRDGLFQLGEERYQIRSAGEDSSRFCLPFIYSAAEQGNEEALDYLSATAEAALADSLPEADEYRFRLALYRALNGDFQRAVQELAALIAQPVDAVGSWLPAAIRFRDAYESPEDLYRACAAEELCNQRLALQRLVSRLTPADFGLLTDYLEEWGVPLNRSRFVDLDGDGQLEQWVLANQSNFEMAAWIFLRTPQGIQALHVDTLTRDDQTFVLERLTPVQGQPVIRLRTGFEERLLAIERDASGNATLTQLRADSGNESQNYTRQLLAESRAALLSDQTQNGAAEASYSPQELLARLLAFQESPSFDCRGAARETLCADYAYTVALAHEMAGDEAGAVAAYRQLWRDYPQSALALIARSKLVTARQAEGAATATDTSAP